jgi:hypothetical protein
MTCTPMRGTPVRMHDYEIHANEDAHPVRNAPMRMYTYGRHAYENAHP